MVLTDKLTNIANKIRAKLSITNLMTLDEMAANIELIPDPNGVADAIIDGSISGNYFNSTVEKISLYKFVGSFNLENVSFSKVTIMDINAFGTATTAYALTNLESAHFPIITEIGASSFRKASSLVAFIMNEITEPPTLSNTNAFLDTPIASGTGFIYCPDDLVDEVKITTNWSTYASQIKGMSECPQVYKTLYNIQ